MYDGTNIARSRRSNRSTGGSGPGSMATCDLGEQMFSGYPRFEPGPRHRWPWTPARVASKRCCAIAGPTDWFAMTHAGSGWYSKIRVNCSRER